MGNTKEADYRSGFKGVKWRDNIDVRGFIQDNYAPYDGGAEFLASAAERTKKLNKKYLELAKKEAERGGVLEIDNSDVSSLLSYNAGYLDKENEIIVGFQTAKPLCRGVNPFGGIRMAEQACRAYGYELSPKIKEMFKYRTTHNDGVFRVYSDEMKAARKSGLITGLPDAYGRGRIIGDYRRVALYGADFLIKEKIRDMEALGAMDMSEEVIRLREEVFRQIDFLDKLKQMAALYGFDISMPASSAHEAVQWLYFGYLAAIKEQNGAAMSLGRVSTFLDIYIKRDLESGLLTEESAQELIDQLVLKLRMARQLRTPDYNELFAGDPTWVTESIGGIGLDGRHLVTRTSYRFLHTLYNLYPAPEPNMTVLWSARLPENFKKYCAAVSIDTDSIQYENDDLMRMDYGDDYAISCCVSAMKIGKQMQFFGARCNLPKVLLMTLNNGRDEMSGEQLVKLPAADDFSDVRPLEYDKVRRNLSLYMAWLCRLYVNTNNVIHYMHDKYAYEKIQMALHDTFVHRFMAFGASGISVIADSLSAIKYARVTPVRDGRGITESFKVEGDFPKYGNDDDRVDFLARELVAEFMDNLRKHKAYRGAEHTLSLLTITSNVVYGKKTGATPDGRPAGAPFAPGANPMHGRDNSGALASLNTVAGIDFCDCRDGISNTFSVTPDTLGKGRKAQVQNLAGLLDGYFGRRAHHLNVNVLNKQKLIEAMNDPDKYPLLTIRVSGYAVRFNSLSKQQQEEVIARTFHSTL